LIIEDLPTFGIPMIRTLISSAYKNIMQYIYMCVGHCNFQDSYAETTLAINCRLNYKCFKMHNFNAHMLEFYSKYDLCINTSKHDSTTLHTQSNKQHYFNKFKTNSILTTGKRKVPVTTLTSVL